MARKPKSTVRDGRDVPNSIAREDDFLRPSLPRPFAYPRSGLNLTILEDRRTFDPEQDFRPARGFRQPRHRLVVRPNTHRAAGLQRPLSLPSQISFRLPQNVLVCVRRQRRKEVLHAIGKAGRVGQRSPRRNPYSEISCRRK